jgi:uncharacterized membrane protein
METMMINNIDEYLQQLKRELSGCDRATIQDALSDAEEHMRNALENLRGAQPDATEESVFPSIVEEYGAPSEIAEAYRKIEAHAFPSPVTKTQQAKPSFIKRFFSSVTDIKAWSALLYLILSLVTGIIFFTWAVTGISISLGLLVLVIGIPFAGVFILSIRGLAFLEGRMVEALLGVRMPHRPLFSNKQPGLWDRFKALISDKYTWSSLAYMILQLPLGIIYFTVFITLIAVSLFLILQPVLELGFGLPLFTINGALYHLNIWPMPFVVVLGILIFMLTLHLAKFTGAMHGKLAQAMLIRK